MSSGFCSFVPQAKTPTPTRITKKGLQPQQSSFVNAFAKKSTQKENISKEKKLDSEHAKKEPTKNKSSSQSFISLKVYNIIYIDSIIKQKLDKRIEGLPSLQDELQEYLEILDSPNSKQKADAQKKIASIRRNIQDLSTTIEYGYYLFQTQPLIDKYVELSSSDVSRSFIKTKTQETKKENKEKGEIISKFVTIARDYVDIEDYARTFNKLICPDCESEDLRRSFGYESIYVCFDCKLEVEMLDDTPTFRDTDRVNMSNRYTYSRKGHFSEAMKKFQGKQNIKVETLNCVVSKIGEEMRFYELTKNTVTKDQIYQFLSEKKLSGHYDDINLLYHIITGNPCPDFSHLEDKLLELFDVQEKALIKVSSDNTVETRVNSINVYYKLYKLLQFLGWPCKKSEFYILKTKQKEDEHDEILKRTWEYLKWDWIPT